MRVLARDRAANELLIATSVLFAIVLSDTTARLLCSFAAVVALTVGVLREIRVRRTPHR